MSLIGIDVGSTVLKISAYTVDGRLLAIVSKPHTPYHPHPGTWEVDPKEVWNNLVSSFRQLVSMESIKQDPPIAIGISASTREAFPVGAEGEPLGPCIMTADTRESGLEKILLNLYPPETWFSFCGHLPERMDPICRLLWWKQNHPDVIEKAKYFLGWAEFISLKLVGKAVADRSHAGRWLTYNFKTHQWSHELISQLKIKAELLPEIRPWGTIIGTLKPDVSKLLGLKVDAELAVGANDAVCCTLGAGCSKSGSGCLMSGSWENILTPITSPPPPGNLIKIGVSIGPYPGKSGWMIYALNPTGSAVLNCVRNLVELSIENAERELQRSDRSPGSIIAIPHFSGALTPWSEGSKLRGTFLGLTLATNKMDIVKAVMESIAYDLFYTVDAFKSMGIKLSALRAIGGGSRSPWWNQLKADLIGIPLETVNQPEVGTVGAALLAGWAIKIFTDPEKEADAFTQVTQRFEPNSERANMYKPRMKLYKDLINDLIKLYNAIL